MLVQKLYQKHRCTGGETFKFAPRTVASPTVLALTFFLHRTIGNLLQHHSRESPVQNRNKNVTSMTEFTA